MPEKEKEKAEEAVPKKNKDEKKEEKE